MYCIVNGQKSNIMFLLELLYAGTLFLFSSFSCFALPLRTNYTTWH